MERDYSGELLRFIQEHPSVYHVIEGQRRILLEAGYEQLLESQHWTLREGGKYFLTRNHSALIAFQVPKKRFRGFMLMASHSDSPALKVKENPEITVGGLYKKLNVELYGGALLAPWLDRPLSVAGRLLVRTSEGVRMQLVNVDRDLLLIPSLAIHMNRSVNDGYAYKVQRDLLPLYGAAEAPDLTALVAETAGISPESVIGHDLFVYNRQAPSIWGADREFMSSPRLDDLQCAFSSLCGFLESAPEESLPVHVVFDNEEIGSSTRQGAASPFLVFTNHSDIPGGTTLGNISVQHVPVKTADVGIAQLAMHSPYETCGTGDTAELIGLARKLFSSSLAENGDGDYTIV